MVRLLLRHVHGKGLEKEGWRGWRALQFAVSSGHEKVGHRVVVSAYMFPKSGFEHSKSTPTWEEASARHCIRRAY